MLDILPARRAKTAPPSPEPPAPPPPEPRLPEPPTPVPEPVETLSQEPEDLPAPEPEKQVSPTEWNIQNKVFKYLRWVKHHSEICPNISLYDWECDMVSITRAGYLHEYEIKISRSDFFADKKKHRKHHILQNGWRPLTEYEKEYLLRTENHVSYDNWLRPNLNLNGSYKKPRPNCFWYVCPDGMVQPEEVPEYAGLMYIPEHYSYRLQEIKVAPKLHKETVTSAQVMSILTSLSFKYWFHREKYWKT